MQEAMTRTNNPRVWVVASVSPYLINPDAANLGAKVCFIYFGLSFPICILMWFYTPETKGLKFEEVRGAILTSRR